MPALQAQIASYAEAMIDTDRPVRAGEVRGRKRRFRSRGAVGLLSAAAALLLLAGATAVLLHEEDDSVVTTADPGTSADDLDGHRNWLLALINGEIDADDAAVRERLSASFLAQVSPDELRRTLEDVGASGPWAILTEVERRERALAVQLESDDGAQARLTLATDADGRLTASTVLLARSCGTLSSPADTEIAPPVEERLQWLLEVVNSKREVTDEDLTAFADSFLADVSPEVLRHRVLQLQTWAPLTVRAHEAAPTSTGVTLRVGIRTGEEARLVLEVGPSAPHQIVALTVLTDQPCVLER